ncbi:MAG: hypothetical protein AB1773_10680 [Pseudomonadota bacterium]
MSRSVGTAALIAALIAAAAAMAQDEPWRAGEAAVGERADGGWIERGFARLERAIARLEARLSGGGSMTAGCEQMMGEGGMGGAMMGGAMMGGGMMGGARPNQQWSRPGEAPSR